MKAVYLESVGGPEVLEYGMVDDPVAGPGEILVGIVAASVNGADWKVRRGIIPNATKAFEGGGTTRYVLGRDFSGVVEALGEGVDDFRVGDRVFGVCDVGQEGTYCERIAMKASLCARAPEGVSHTDLCALALTSTTAIVCLEECLDIRPNEKVLVTGGAGGVGHFAVALAHHLGASPIVTTTSTPNLGYVKAAVPPGSELRVIDYTTTDLVEEVLQQSGGDEPLFDAILDTVGGDVANSVFAVLKPSKEGGRAAFIASGKSAPEPPSPGLTALRPNVYRSRKHLERLGELLAAGAIPKPQISRFSLAQAREAHALSESRHFKGKLVFCIRPEEDETKQQ